MLNDPLANVLSAICNRERVGKRELMINPVSKVITQVLEIMKDALYVGELEMQNEGRGGFAKLNLLGNVNKCGVIKPRFSVGNDEFEKWEKRYLPAKGVGILIISTSQGIMTHTKAREKGIGGRLIAYCF